MVACCKFVGKSVFDDLNEKYKQLLIQSRCSGCDVDDYFSVVSSVYLQYVDSLKLLMLGMDDVRFDVRRNICNSWRYQSVDYPARVSLMVVSDVSDLKTFHLTARKVHAKYGGLLTAVNRKMEVQLVCDYLSRVLKTLPWLIEYFAPEHLQSMCCNAITRKIPKSVILKCLPEVNWPIKTKESCILSERVMEDIARELEIVITRWRIIAVDYKYTLIKSIILMP